MPLIFFSDSFWVQTAKLNTPLNGSGYPMFNQCLLKPPGSKAARKKLVSLNNLPLHSSRFLFANVKPPTVSNSTLYYKRIKGFFSTT